IHHRDESGLACEHSLYASARKTAATESSDAPDALIMCTKFLGQGRATIGRIVVDKDDLPTHSRQKGTQPLGNDGDIVALVEGWNDDCQFGSGTCCQRTFANEWLSRRVAEVANDLIFIQGVPAVLWHGLTCCPNIPSR